MEKQVTIFLADIDGTYSSVKKVICTPEFAEQVLESQPEEYFKCFGDAKQEVMKHVYDQYQNWKKSVEYIRSLKVTMIETTTWKI